MKKMTWGNSQRDEMKQNLWKEKSAESLLKAFIDKNRGEIFQD